MCDSDESKCDHLTTPDEDCYYKVVWFRSTIDRISGKWMIFYSKDKAISLWDKLVSDAKDGKLDTPCMKRSGGKRNPRATDDKYVIIIYTDGDIKRSTALGYSLLNYIVGNYPYKYLYWKSEEQTQKGSATTGSICNYERRIWISKRITKRTAKSTCDMCGGGTKGKTKRAGLCTDCYDPTKIRISSGNYEGKLFIDVVAIIPKDRIYGNISNDDLKTLFILDSSCCKNCLSIQPTKKVISDKWPYCLRCFQTGHVKYSSGKYVSISVMLIRECYKYYDGKDLNDDDKNLYDMSIRLNDKLIIDGEAICTWGPCTGMKWKDVTHHPNVSAYKDDVMGRSCNLVVYCATLEHLATGDDVDYRKF